jgi:C_GCAxxG_C_C family probable redox protein
MTQNILFDQGYNCCQAVLAEYTSRLELPEPEAFRIGAAFGAGMGRRGHVCGAVSGALMVIGLRFSRFDPEDLAARDLVYAHAQRFLIRFEQEHGSLYCRELLGRDFSVHGQYELARQEQLFDRSCPGYVNGAIELLAEHFSSS